jgi:peroxiredoxin Q/BCP
VLLSDEDHAIADKYGVWGLKKFMGREFMGIIRTTFVIDKNGKLAHVMDKVKTRSHHDDVLEILKSF